MKEKTLNFYHSAKPLLIAVDCIVFGFDEDKLKLLLIKRTVEPQKGKWSLEGGFVKPDESVDGAARRVLYALTGLKNIYLEQLYTYGDVARDNGARVISVAYYALINVDDYNHNLGEQYGAHWVEVNKLPKLIFDHSAMVSRAIERLKELCQIKPVGIDLLPQKFTLTQLKNLYDAIHQKHLDKRNFRKWIYSLNILEKLNIKDKSSSRKGAYLYRFKSE